MKTLQIWLGSLILALGAVAPACAEQWPAHPIKLVVPYTAGGQFDIVARLLAERMGARLGQPVVVENKPGNNTLIGADYVAKARNDGYTLLYAGANMFAIAPHLYSKMPFKRSDFQTISLVSELPMGLIVNGKLPVRTFAEFVDYVKANPGKLSFGTSGEGGAQHLLCELLQEKTGMRMNHISYKGTNQNIQDLIPGRLAASCDGLQSYFPYAQNGELRILGVSSAQRLSGHADIPTFAELGVPDATVASWGGIVAPAGLPPAVFAALRKAVVAAASDPEVQEKIVSSAAVPRTATPAEFDRVIQADSDKWRAVIRRLGLKFD